MAEWHLAIASRAEVEACLAEPRALYAIASESIDGELHANVVALHGGLHWLISGELPGETAEATPLAFLERGGTAFELRKKLNGSVVVKPRWFSPHDRLAIAAALDALDREALMRKGGAPSLEVIDAIRRVIVPNPATRFIVTPHACFELPVAAIPIFEPPLAKRKTTTGELPEVATRAIGGDEFIGFGAGPALVVGEIANPTTTIEKLIAKAQQRGDAAIAYRRLASWQAYETAKYWLELGYFEVDEVADQLAEELDEDVNGLMLAAAATSALLELERATWPARTDCDRLFAALDELRASGVLVLEYAGFTTEQAVALVGDARRFCFFNQQCILRALDGEGLDLYVGDAAEVEAALAAQGLQADAHDDVLTVKMIWQCRPRRHARTQPQ